MGYWQTLFAPGFFIPLIVVAVLQPAVRLLGERIEYHAQHAFLVSGVAEYLLQPLFYALLTLLFVMAAYPVLFGFTEAPPFSALLAFSGRELGHLINLLVMLGLLLPVVPLLGRCRGSVTAIQIMIVSALLFHWLAMASKAQGAPRLWPPATLLFQLVGASLLLHRMAFAFAGIFGEKVDRAWHVSGSALLLEPMFDFFLQGAVVLRYTLFLGEQVAVRFPL